MALFKCEICGGDLAVSLNSELAVCENCGNTAEVDSEELGKIRRIYREAEVKTYTQSVSAYQDAINLFQSISYVKEAREKIAACENRLSELKEAEENRAESNAKSDKSAGRIGIIILIMFTVVLALLISGIVYIVYHLKAGDLSPTATAIIISVIAVSFVALIISKIKS